MADLPTVFTESAATRIGAATRWAELQQGVPSTDPNENYGAAIGGQISLVQTDATLPGGYNGAMGAPGQVIEKQANGTINKLGAIWIKDINGGTLSASTIYQARIGGTWTQDVTTNGIVTPTTLGLYLVQTSGAAFNLVYLGPWRYDLISAKLKNGTYTYTLCVIWAETNPDTTDCAIFTESSYFDYNSNRAADYLTQPNSGSAALYSQSLFKVFEFNGARSFTIKDIELAPYHIWAACRQQMILSKSDFVSLTDFSSDTIGGGNHIGSPYMFTRRVKKNPDGSPQSVPVSIYGNNANYFMRPFLTTKAWPADGYLNKVNTYTPNSQIIKFLGMDDSYKQQGSDGIIGQYATGANVTIKSYCEDPLGLGYPATGVSYILNQINGRLTATAVGRLPNSPMYVPTTTGGIGSGIGSGISGV